MIRRFSFFIIFLSLCQYGQSQVFGGNDPALNWREITDKHSRIIFPLGADSQANRIRHIIAVLNSRDEKNDSMRSKQWPVILQTQSIQPNAYVRMAPFMSELYMTPPQDNFSLGSLRWDDNLIIHEQRHMRQFSYFNRGLTRLFSFFLGQEGRLLANGMSIPDYFFEGDAVWQETELSRQGRGRLPYFMNAMRANWQAGKGHSWMAWRSGSLRKLLPDHYTLGYVMVAYGHQKFGNAFWDNVTRDASSFRGLFYPFNRAVARYAGSSYRSFTKDAMAHAKRNLLAFDSLSDKDPVMLTKPEKGNVIDELFPVFVGRDSVIVSRRSYREVSAFYLISRGTRKKIRVRDPGLDDYYSTDGKYIVYAAYESDPRWGNREYSVLKRVDISSGQQIRLTGKSRYFSPVMHPGGHELLAVKVNTDGSNQLQRLSVSDGKLLSSVPNPQNLFFTQSVYRNDSQAVSATRLPDGRMTLALVDLGNGYAKYLLPPSYSVIGYPSMAGDTVYFSAQDRHTDQVFAMVITSGHIYRVTGYRMPVYYPAVQSGKLVFSAYTSEGQLLGERKIENDSLLPMNQDEWGRDDYSRVAWQPLAGEPVFLDTLHESSIPSKPFRKSSGLINIHSRRPVIDDPEWGYSLYSDNFFSTLSSSLTYTYNRVERSHTFGAGAVYGGWFPYLGLSAEMSLNRNIDTALGKSVSFHSAKWSGGVAIPLQWVKGKNSHSFYSSLSYNNEQLYYRGIGKDLFGNRSFKYLQAGLSLARSGRQARQHIFPHWAQSVSAVYRYSVSDAVHRKLTVNSAWYFPGLFVNHSIVLNASYQKRDSLPDIYSNSFSYSRGYDALSTRRMYKWGINYHLPLLYPDMGLANIVYCYRVRANMFYDHTEARARVNGVLTDIRNRSTGAELYFDTKIWNSLPVSLGVRYAYLLDDNLRNPSVRNRWEIVLPVGIIPR